MVRDIRLDIYASWERCHMRKVFSVIILIYTLSRHGINPFARLVSINNKMQERLSAKEKHRLLKWLPSDDDREVISRFLWRYDYD